MYTSNHIVTPQNNSAVTGNSQDTTCGMYILTNTWNDGTETLVPRHVAFDCYATASIDFSRVEDTFRRAEKWYGKYVRDGKIISAGSTIPGKLFVSVLFPPETYYTRKTDTNDNYPVFKVEQGIILPDSAPICKNIIGAKGLSVQHIMWKESSKKRALQFYTEIEFLTYSWMPRHGFSMGLSDCMTTNPQAVKDALREMTTEIDAIESVTSDLSIREGKINNAFKSAMNIAPTLAKKNMYDGERNALSIMLRSGTKGSLINCAQISAFVGQQYIDGKRIQQTLSGGTRTLPHFRKGDGGVIARGFIFNNYVHGLTPPETFFHGAAGRRGITDTAIKTATTGYIQKRLARILEDIKIVIDGTARSAHGSIVQFVYGDDGMNPKRLYNVPNVTYPFFCNLDHIIRRVLNEFKSSKKRKLTSKEIDLILSYISAGIPGVQTLITRHVTTTVHATLKKLLSDVEICEEAIPALCKKLVDEYEISKVEAGEMVGLIASHALGEKVTQMTLNSFHSTGNKEMDISLGVPRLEELIRCSKTSTTPMNTVHSTDPVMIANATLILQLEKEKTVDVHRVTQLKNESYRIARDLGYRLERTLVKDVLETVEMVYTHTNFDPKKHTTPISAGITTYGKYTKQWWEEWSDTDVAPKEWAVMLRFKKKELFRRKLTLAEIAKAISRESNNHLHCAVSPLSLLQIAVYINFDEVKEFVKTVIELPPGENASGILSALNTSFFTTRDVVIPMIENTPLRGIEGIEKAFPREDKTTKMWVVDTKGSNISEVLGQVGVSVVHTTSNDLYQVYTTFGIEAVKRFLCREINMVLSSYGIYVNPRHIVLLAARMTQSGELSAVTEKGISRDCGPVAKLSFESPIENAVVSSVFTENDTLDSVSSTIMFGRFPKVGTGVVEIKRDESVLTV